MGCFFLLHSYFNSNNLLSIDWYSWHSLTTVLTAFETTRLIRLVNVRNSSDACGVGVHFDSVQILSGRRCTCTSKLHITFTGSSLPYCVKSSLWHFHQLVCWVLVRFNQCYSHRQVILIDQLAKLPLNEHLTFVSWPFQYLPMNKCSSVPFHWNTKYGIDIFYIHVPNAIFLAQQPSILHYMSI